jgi:leader peptidase (prepilin peptidase) / N-methyltransferase
VFRIQFSIHDARRLGTAPKKIEFWIHDLSPKASPVAVAPWDADNAVVWNSFGMKALFTTLPLMVTAGLFGAVGLCVGNALFRWVVRMTDEFRGDGFEPSVPPEEPSPARFVPLFGPLLSPAARRYRGVNVAGWGTVMELATAGLFASFVVAKLRFDCQAVVEVRPDELWRYGRIVYHLVLIALLVAATGTDFRDYVIPDRIVILGVCIGIAGAVLSGDLQTIHLWVDWNQEIPGYRGAFIPQWIIDHHHLHGLAWSLAGVATGAGLTWIVRALSSWMLGQEALGFGDVTLMAMIGSFLGWQPVLVVLVLAPFCGLVAAVLVRVFAGRIIVPYGPFLAAATLIALFGWRWLWTFELDAGLREPLSVRRLFGDWVAIATLAGIAFAALLVLLTLLRLYRSAPVGKKNRARANGDFE